MLATAKAASSKTQKCLKPHGTSGFRQYGAKCVCIKDGMNIDPPYNTGNDFVYNDDFKQKAADYLENSGQYDEDGNQMVQNTESNGRFHTDWLNMMYPRLKLAKDLLADDGVIFISIDDNEQENLKKMCDEIFGSNNFIAQLVWEKKKKVHF